MAKILSGGLTSGGLIWGRVLEREKIQGKNNREIILEG
jgi:hypothetical protein